MAPTEITELCNWSTVSPPVPSVFVYMKRYHPKDVSVVGGVRWLLYWFPPEVVSCIQHDLVSYHQDFFIQGPIRLFAATCISRNKSFFYYWGCWKNDIKLGKGTECFIQAGRKEENNQLLLQSCSCSLSPFHQGGYCCDLHALPFPSDAVGESQL